MLGDGWSCWPDGRVWAGVSCGGKLLGCDDAGTEAVKRRAALQKGGDGRAWGRAPALAIAPLIVNVNAADGADDGRGDGNFLPDLAKILTQ